MMVLHIVYFFIYPFSGGFVENNILEDNSSLKKLQCFGRWFYFDLQVTVGQKANLLGSLFGLSLKE